MPGKENRRALRGTHALTALIVLLLAAGARAEGMAPLAQLEGSFRIVPVTEPASPTATPGHSTISSVYGGLALEEDERIPVSPEVSFGIRHLITWDPYRKLYRVSALDDGTGLLDVYEGVYANGSLTVSNLSTGTFFPRDDGGWTAFRLQWSNLSEGGFDFEASTSIDAGVSWSTYVKLRYERIPGT